MQPDSSVRKVLIYRLGSLGDTVVALPGYHLIARTFPNAERVLLTNFPVHSKAPAAAAVLGDSGLVHGYMRYTVGTRRVGELVRLAWQIRRLRPDVLVYMMRARPLMSMRRDRLFFRLACGVRRIVGIPDEAEIRETFDLSTGLLKRRFDPMTGRYESEAARTARMLAELGDAHTEDRANWSLDLTGREREAAAKALADVASRPLIVCGPGTKMQAKDWGKDNWRSLLARLYAEYPEHALALVGAIEDAEESDYAAREWSGPKVNLCGRLTPRETAAVIEHAMVFLGPDSGPMHLADSVGVPCVIAFSAIALPGVWFPSGPHHQIIYHQTSCYNCGLETCTVEGRRCLTSISVADMAEAVARVIGSSVKDTALSLPSNGRPYTQ